MSEGFSDGATTPDVTTETKVEQTERKYLEELIGEGKKYKSLEEGFEALAKKAEHADNFIETLKGEKQQLEQQYQEQTTKTRTVDEIVELLRQPTPAPTKVEEPKKEDQPKGITLEDVQRFLEEKEQLSTAKQKADNLWARLSSEEVFGSAAKAKEVVAKYINGDSAKKTLVDQMAMYDPSGLELLLKSSVSQESNVSFMDTSSSEKNSEAVTIGKNKLTWDVVNKIRKENPKLYHSKEFRDRMYNEL